MSCLCAQSFRQHMRTEALRATALAVSSTGLHLQDDVSGPFRWSDAASLGCYFDAKKLQGR